MRTSLSSRRSNFATTQHFCPTLLSFIARFAVYKQQFVVYAQRFQPSWEQGIFFGFCFSIASRRACLGFAFKSMRNSFLH